MIYENPILYPPEMRTSDLAKCSIPIDELIYDNTYCDPIFKFPKSNFHFYKLLTFLSIYNHYISLKILMI